MFLVCVCVCFSVFLMCFQCVFCCVFRKNALFRAQREETFFSVIVCFWCVIRQKVCVPKIGFGLEKKINVGFSVSQKVCVPKIGFGLEKKI